MSKVRRRSVDSFDDADLFADMDFDADNFIEVMEQKRSKPARPGWRRIEDLREHRLLRDQLQDWDDWEN